MGKVGWRGSGLKSQDPTQGLYTAGSGVGGRGPVDSAFLEDRTQQGVVSLQGPHPRTTAVSLPSASGHEWLRGNRKIEALPHPCP